MTREQAWKYIQKWKPDGAPMEWQKAYYIVIEKGEWKQHKTKSNKNWWECSQCGHVEMKRYPYCSICGADMRGKE